MTPLPGGDATRNQGDASVSASSSSSGDKGKHRQRTSMACVHCRRRKIRCDGAEPACSTCQRLNKPCDYEAITEEENVVAREKKRASRLRKAHMAGMTASPGLASSSRYVVPSLGTPYGTLRTADSIKWPGADYSHSQSSSVLDAVASIRRRGITVSTPGLRTAYSEGTMHPPAFAPTQNSKPVDTSLTGQSTSDNDWTTGLPAWAHTTFSAPTDSWSSQAPSSTQELVYPQHDLEAHRVRRRSSVDDLSWAQPQHTAQLRNYVNNWARTETAAPTDHHSSLSNRSSSHQQLSQQQMWNWNRFFGDRSRVGGQPPLLEDATSPVEAAITEADRCLSPQRQSPRQVPQPASAFTPALLSMDLSSYQGSNFLDHQVTPPTISPASFLGQEDRRESSGTHSAGSTSSASVPLPVRGQVHGQEHLEASFGNVNLHMSPANVMATAQQPVASPISPWPAEDLPAHTPTPMVAGSPGVMAPYQQQYGNGDPRFVQSHWSPNHGPPQASSTNGGGFFGQPVPQGASNQGQLASANHEHPGVATSMPLQCAMPPPSQPGSQLSSATMQDSVRHEQQSHFPFETNPAYAAPVESSAADASAASGSSEQMANALQMSHNGDGTFRMPSWWMWDPASHLTKPQ